MCLLLTGCGSPGASDVREYLQGQFDAFAEGGFEVESVSEVQCIEYVQNGVKGYRFSYLTSVRALKNGTLSNVLGMPRLAEHLGDLKSVSSLKRLLFADRGEVVLLEGDVHLLKTEKGWIIP